MVLEGQREIQRLQEERCFGGAQFGLQVMGFSRFFSISAFLCFEIIGPRFCEFLMLVIASPFSLLAVRSQ